MDGVITVWTTRLGQSCTTESRTDFTHGTHILTESIAFRNSSIRRRCMALERVEPTGGVQNSVWCTQTVESTLSSPPNAATILIIWVALPTARFLPCDSHATYYSNLLVLCSRPVTTTPMIKAGMLVVLMIFIRCGDDLILIRQTT